MRAQRLCLRFALSIVGLLALIAAPNLARAAAADGLPEPICWRQLAFSIPFKVAPVESPDQQPTEVRLYVSVNQGVQWEIAQRVSPQQNSFTFRAPHDGEYWFQIRTADRQGRVVPEVANQPELRVIVDTMRPRLDLTAARGEAGEIKASWQAVDPLLNPDSLKIEYQTSTGSWRPVAISPTSGGRDRSTNTGTLTWFPTDAPAGSVAVRAEVTDQAGNVTDTQAQANLSGGNVRRDLTASNSANNPVTPPAGNDRNWNSNPSPNWSSAPNSSSPAAPRLGTPDGSTGNSAALPPKQSSGFMPPSFAAASAPTQKQLAGDPGATPWPRDRYADQPLGRNPIPSDDLSNQPANNSRWSEVATQPQRPTDQSRYGDVANRAVEDVSPPIRNQMLPDNQFARNDRSPNTRFSDFNPSSNPSLAIPDPLSSRERDGVRVPSSGMLPPGERPRMVNSRSFDLDYDVDGVGPSGIARVELWGTRDGGRTWNSYAIDNDNRSPIHATVEGEGLYGFRVVVQSGNGIGGIPPHSGDSPDLWVTVDLTKPVVRLVDATAGDGPHSGELLIRWEASDAALASRPITLLFTDRPGGQWSIIAAGLDNSGQYAWRPDSRAPDRIYLRIEANDEAGNTGIFEAAQPVTLDRIRPSGRLRGVRPTGDPAGA